MNVAVDEARQIPIPIDNPGRSFKIQTREGKTGNITEGQLRQRIAYACRGLEGTKSEEVLQESIKNLYEGVRWDEVDTSCVMAPNTGC